MSNIECYLFAVRLLETMRKNGIISDSEFSAAEAHFAEKNCIKKDSIYRQNDLINFPFRAIYSVPNNKEVPDGNSKKS